MTGELSRAPVHQGCCVSMRMTAPDSVQRFLSPATSMAATRPVPVGSADLGRLACACRACTLLHMPEKLVALVMACCCMRIIAVAIAVSSSLKPGVSPAPCAPCAESGAAALCPSSCWPWDWRTSPCQQGDPPWLKRSAPGSSNAATATRCCARPATRHQPPLNKQQRRRTLCVYRVAQCKTVCARLGEPAGGAVGVVWATSCAQFAQCTCARWA